MKNIQFALFLGLILSLTSCMSFYETINFNEDGSGNYEMKMDMAELVAGLEGLGGMAEMFGGEMMEGEMGDMDIAGALDSMMVHLDTIQMDTVISLRNMPRNEIAGIPDSELLDKISLKMKMNKEEGVFEYAFFSEFDNFEQLDEIMTILERLKNDVEFGGPGSMGEFIPVGGEDFWTLKRNRLAREDIGVRKSIASGLGETEMDMFGEGDMSGMMSMFMGGSVYRTEINFPSKVKKVTLEGAKVKGNTVILEHKLLDLMDSEEEKDYSGYIKFKKTWK